ncbi:hypothetical protein GE115_01605 [Agromyces sp. CFH 90414]|uniref:LppX_LprAFG lipoprotein n=1 Tax=Agromyces agglutinans TaxID=2662258 RepID=A0A6I2F4D0_9MICO|nr:hypothetical protein [Agromyces agglutinans]MRG58577.1 hypothetical protein [Agromyces agglutinans]
MSLRRLLLPATIVPALLIGCAPVPTAATSTETPAPAVGGATAPAEAAVPVTAALAECSGLELHTAGASVAGAALAQCLQAFIEAARTGSARLEHALPSEQRWLVVDAGAYVLHDRLDGGKIAITPDAGWSESDGVWIRADPNGSVEEIIADQVVEAARGLAMPAAIGGFATAGSAFTVGEPEELGLPDGLSRSLTPIAMDAPIDVDGVYTIDEMVFYGDETVPLVAMKTTATMPGLPSETSMTYFADWGAEVDLDEIEELTGTELPIP